MGGGLPFELPLAGYGGWRKEFRRKEASGSWSFQAAFLPIGGAREAATGLEWQLGRRPIIWDRCGGLGRPDGGREECDRNGLGERRNREEKREKKKTETGL